MLELSKIRENPDNIIKNLAIKNFSASEIVALILQLDEKRRQLQKENDACLAQQNKMASEIGIAMKAGKKDDAEQLKEKNAVLKETSKKLQAELETTENLLQDELVKLPNIPSEKVSPGKSAADNDIVFTVTGTLHKIRPYRF